jgi:hypothetical protein
VESTLNALPLRQLVEVDIFDEVAGRIAPGLLVHRVESDRKPHTTVAPAVHRGVVCRQAIRHVRTHDRYWWFRGSDGYPEYLVSEIV